MNQDLRFRTCTYRRSRSRSHGFPHRVRGDALVPRARDHAQLEGLQQIDRRVERRLHSGRDAQQQAIVSRQTLSRSVESHTQHNRLAE